MIADKISYCDKPGCRVLDLRPDGVDCIPVLGHSDFSTIRPEPDLHYHPGCMEFCLCLKGNLIFDTLDREYPFLPGRIFVSSPEQPHHLRNNPSGLQIYRILFKIPKFQQRILGLDRRESEWITRSLTHLPKRLFASTPEVRFAFDRIFDIYDTLNRKSPSRRIRMHAAAVNLLIALIDASRQAPAKVPEKIDEIAARILNAPEAEYPIEEIARECNIAVSTFASRFKQAKGLPLHAYQLNCRIKKAKDALLHSKRTVTAIGQELRFYSTQHFAKTFRRIVGVNPQTFRLRGTSVNVKSGGPRVSCRTSDYDLG